MHGLMMNTPLLITDIMRHAERCHGDTEVVSVTVDTPRHRTTLGEVFRRTRRLANALAHAGIGPGDRVGTLAWNDYRHLELYYGVSCMGAVLHTVNPRLFPEQVNYIINHAQDRLLFVDPLVLPLVEKLKPALKSVEQVVVLTDDEHLPASGVKGLRSYESFIADEQDSYDWPELDENTASSLCYTSGTTGNPKGVLYSHRSTILHAYGAALPDALDLSARDAVLPVVPMFHANAWSLPYACTMVGAKMVFPGPHLDGKSVYELIEQEKVTLSAGVPTVWLMLLQHLAATKSKFSTLDRTVIGGSACPPAMIRAFQEDYGVTVFHAWGMTEMSPLGTVGSLKAKQATLSKEEQRAVQAKQGRGIFGVEMKIVDEEGKDLPWDGKRFGNLLVKGPWIASGYMKGEGGNPLKDGWFPTGDVATIDPDGYMQITDRSKDVIKSGGEWISSIDLENIAVAHPAVQEAAVIGIRHPKWDERPIVVAVKKAGQALSREELLKFYEGKIAKWWMPDDVVFVEELPHTATGKLSKLTLREKFKDYRLPTA
ncbi:MAG: 3-(methylthio)propionyl-CoA ligase [Betaproteobacteria bacterium]|nr:3-(methylthio)propionyl-CoA ligase [Betaproteobacteria bacterium]